MAVEIYKVETIQVKRANQATWDNDNPILLDGEIAVERDTHQIKVGDGVTQWDSLPYVTASNSIAGLSDVSSGTPSDKNFLIGDGANWTSRAAVLADISDYTATKLVSDLDAHLGGTRWRAVEIPAGGTTGQVLKKVSGTNYDYAWSTDASGGTNLSYTASPTDGLVTSSSGTDATLPLGDATNAGLLAPADFTKLSHITVTQAVNLDTMESDIAGKANASHTHTEADITDLKNYLLATDIDTLAELNTILTDATLIDTNDSRLSDARTPTAHTHVVADITDFNPNNYVNKTGTATIENGLKTDDVTALILESNEASNQFQILIERKNTGGKRVEVKAIEQGIGYHPIMINPTGGNVTIGTAIDSGDKLNIGGNTNINGNLTLTGTVDGIDIATDVAANTAKISADGSIGTHSDVYMTGITDGQILKWVTANSRFEPAADSGVGSGSTNLGYNASPTDGTVTSDTGTNATIPLVDGTNAGLMAPGDFTKLSGIESGATADQTSIVGISGTKAQFNTELTDGTFMFVGDAPTAHTHTASEITDFDTEVSNNTSVTANTAKVSADGSISTHSDVNVATPAANHALMYNNTNSRFENRLLTESDISDFGSYAAASHTHATTDITSGTFADARIAASNVTQHQAALSITESQISDLQTYALDADVVKLTGNQSISGIKTFNNRLDVVSGTDEVARFKGGAADAAYISFFADAAAQTTRSAYIGFGSAASENLNIFNEHGNGHTQIGASGSGRIKLLDGTDITGTLVVSSTLQTDDDISALSTGSTPANPRVIGISGFTSGTSGTSGRFQFGDEHNSLAASDGSGMILQCYNTIHIRGGKESFTYFQPPANEGTIGTAIYTGAADKSVVIRELASQTADPFKIQDSGLADIFAVTTAGNVVLSGTVDGRDVAADGTKLDGIEAGATADQTAAEIKTAYESNADTNAFTDADHTKLDGIATSATNNDSTSSTGTSIALDTNTGRYMNMSSANTATTYTTTGTTLGAFAVVRINAASEPTVTGATKIPGSTFAASTDMHMVVQYFGTTVQYYFLALS